MKATEVLKRIMAELSSQKVKFAQMKLDNGTTLEAEAFESGNEVFIVNEEDRIALPTGEYTLEDSRVLVITEEGIIAEVRDAASEEMPEEPSEEVEASESASPKKVVESHIVEQHFAEDVSLEDNIKSVVLPLIEEMRAELAALREEMGLAHREMEAKEKEVEEMKAELSAQSAAKPIKHNPEKKTEVKLGKRPATSFDRVLAKLNN